MKHATFFTPVGTFSYNATVVELTGDAIRFGPNDIIYFGDWDKAFVIFREMKQALASKNYYEKDLRR